MFTLAELWEALDNAVLFRLGDPADAKSRIADLWMRDILKGSTYNSSDGEIRFADGSVHTFL